MGVSVVVVVKKDVKINIVDLMSLRQIIRGLFV